jgi:3',5'-cyclic AMP phosphodiesterase CpdA
LVHSGDFTLRGTEKEIKDFNEWLGTLKFKHKIIIAGNHDFAFEQNPEARSWITNATYLQDESIVIEGIKFYGSPW